MKRTIALISVLLLTYPVTTSLAVETTNLSTPTHLDFNLHSKEEIELEKALETLDDEGTITLKDISENIIKSIEKDPTLTISSKQNKIAAVKNILEESNATRSNLGFSYVKPGPGRIRIFIPPAAINIITVVGLATYVSSVIASLGLTAGAAGVITGLIGYALSNQAVYKYGFTLHGWNNYKDWNFRVGNTLAG